jgi:hypothetical protein
MRKTKAQRAKSISNSARKYGSQGIVKCHHPARSPRVMIQSATTPTAAPPINALPMRRGVARVRKARPARITRYIPLRRWSCCVVMLESFLAMT